MRSHVLEGRVRHRRARPFSYSLEHAVTYLAVDIDELAGIGHLSRLLGRNQRAPLELRDADHFDPPADDLGEAIHAHLEAAGEYPAGWRITLVTYPRVIGYVFNPASFYLCRDVTGELRVVVIEVHNTHGERHLYTLRPRSGEPAFVASTDKTFYVSPFLEVRGGYAVRVRDEPSRLRITINHEDADGLLLHASLDLARRPLTDRSLARMLLRYPLVTYKTTVMIHWHALRLWLRRAPFRRHRAAAR